MDNETVSKNFIENIIDKDLEEGVYDTVHTRFPPEPNGYLHIGHAKSILLNYGLAKKYNGKFNLRFDDTNPTKEKSEFVESIKADVKWLGADWEDRLFFASDYFGQMYEAAVKLIKKGKVDMVMTAHIINANIDPEHPATLSRKTIDGVLRKQLGYDGVVVSDDMYMEGIIKKYDIENALVLAINAGCDLLCVGNNINTGFEADRPFRLVDLIVKNVKNGRIPWGRIVQSHRRIEKLLKKLK